MQSLLKALLGLSEPRITDKAAKAKCYQDTTPFNIHRNNYWKALRAKYPTPFAPQPLEATTWKDPRTYLRECSIKWGDGTGAPPEANAAMTHMYRNAMIQSLPNLLLKKLNDTVGLQEINDAQWTVTHHMLQFAKGINKRTEEEEQLRVQLLRAQVAAAEGPKKKV